MRVGNNFFPLISSLVISTRFCFGTIVQYQFGQRALIFLLWHLRGITRPHIVGWCLVQSSRDISRELIPQGHFIDCYRKCPFKQGLTMHRFEKASRLDLERNLAHISKYTPHRPFLPPVVAFLAWTIAYEAIMTTDNMRWGKKVSTICFSIPLLLGRYEACPLAFLGFSELCLRRIELSSLLGIRHAQNFRNTWEVVPLCLMQSLWSERNRRSLYNVRYRELYFCLK